MGVGAVIHMHATLRRRDRRGVTPCPDSTTHTDVELRAHYFGVRVGEKRFEGHQKEEQRK